MLYDPMNVYKGKYKEFIESLEICRNLYEDVGHTHKHHVIPICCDGKDNDIDNHRYYLTYREHFVAHKLLAQENPNNKGLQYAFWMMASHKVSEATPEEYEDALIRIEPILKSSTKFFKEGVPLSEEHRRNISKAKIGEPLSEELKKKLSKIAKINSQSDSHKKQFEENVYNHRENIKQGKVTFKCICVDCGSIIYSKSPGRRLCDECYNKRCKEYENSLLSKEERAKISAENGRKGSAKMVETKRNLGVLDDLGSKLKDKQLSFNLTCKCCNQQFIATHPAIKYCQACKDKGIAPDWDKITNTKVSKEDRAKHFGESRCNKIIWYKYPDKIYFGYDKLYEDFKEIYPELSYMTMCRLLSGYISSITLKKYPEIGSERFKVMTNKEYQETLD